MSHQKMGGLSQPWLWLPSKFAHDAAPYVLPIISSLTPKFEKTWRPLSWRGLSFANPLGIAGGVDKTGLSLKAWQGLGAGFLEVGTVTPLPQGPNPGLIMDRDISKQALWNKMGFPNVGADKLAQRLQGFSNRRVPLFINIGKNRQTANADAHLDYIQCVKKMSPFADVFVVNISSPNTKGLRDLLNESELAAFLNSLKEGAQKFAEGKPFLLKLSPDMESETIEMALNTSAPFMDGWILTNTTKQRYEGCPFSADEGGVSGAPLCELSKKALNIAAPFKQKHPEKLLISVGGINTAQEILDRLEMGADLVQFYSALIFGGPHFFRNALNSLRA